MSKLSLLEDALKLVKIKGSEGELAKIAKKLSPEEWSTVERAYKAQFKPGYYHGTPAAEPFEAFDLSRGASTYDNDTPIGAAFVTKNPEFAENFRLHGRGSVLPLRVNTEGIFDYHNPEHIAKLIEEVKRNPRLTKIGQEISEEPFVNVNGKKLNSFIYHIRRGDYEMLEHPETIQALKNLGFDGMHVAEGGEKNIALFDPNVDARYETAKFDPLKKDTGNLLSSLGIATGAGLAASAMMPEESEAATIWKPTEVSRLLDRLSSAKKLTAPEFLKGIGYSAPKNTNDVSKIRMALRNALEHGLRERAGLPMSSPNWRVNEEISKIFNPELREIYPVLEGGKAEKAMSERGIKDAEGVFYSDPTKNLHIPYKGKDIAVLNDSPALLHHEDQHALEYLLHPTEMHDKTLGQFFKGKNSSDVYKETNEDLAKKLSILSNGERSVEEIKQVLDKIRPEQIGESKELRRFINDQTDKFKIGDAGHFIQYPETFELHRALEMLKDEVKVPKGSLKENKKLIEEILKNPHLGAKEVEKRLAQIAENATMVPSAKKSRYILPDKMPFAVTATAGAGLLSALSPEDAKADKLDALEKSAKKSAKDMNVNYDEVAEVAKRFGLDIEDEKVKNYLEKLNNSRPKTPKPDFTKTMGENTGSALNYLMDKLSSITVKKEDEKDEEGNIIPGDYTPVNLAETPDAPLRVLNAAGKVADIPAGHLRKFVYNTLLDGKEKNEVSGHDIANLLEDKVGAPVPNFPGASFTGNDVLSHGIEFGLDPLVLPAPKIFKAVKEGEAAAKLAEEGLKNSKILSKADIFNILKGK